MIGVDPPELEAREVEVRRLRIDGPRPALLGADAEEGSRETDDPFDAWAAMLEGVLQSWI